MTTEILDLPPGSSSHTAEVEVRDEYAFQICGTTSFYTWVLPCSTVVFTEFVPFFRHPQSRPCLNLAILPISRIEMAQSKNKKNKYTP